MRDDGAAKALELFLTPFSLTLLGVLCAFARVTVCPIFFSSRQDAKRAKNAFVCFSFLKTQMFSDALSLIKVGLLAARR